MVVGLTGGSGTGKSTACDFFRKRGYIIVDSDKIARKVCEKGEKCFDDIVDAFGTSVLNEDGTLDRAKLGGIVFSNKEKLELLNQITHKYIIQKNMEIIKNNPDANIVLDAPLLFEAGLDKVCHEIICVLSDIKKRAERIMERDLITLEKAMARINSQPDDDFYIERCTHVLYNNTTVGNLVEQLENIYGGEK